MDPSFDHGDLFVMLLQCKTPTLSTYSTQMEHEDIPISLPIEFFCLQYPTIGMCFYSSDVVSRLRVSTLRGLVHDCHAHWHCVIHVISSRLCIPDFTTILLVWISMCGRTRQQTVDGSCPHWFGTDLAFFAGSHAHSRELAMDAHVIIHVEW